jgi:hypothetical protein
MNLTQRHSSVPNQVLVLGLFTVFLALTDEYDGVMYSAQRAIRIVKRKRQELLTEDESLLCLKTTSQSKRDMIQTVTSWIIERREEVALEQRRCYALTRSK